MSTNTEPTRVMTLPELQLHADRVLHVMRIGMEVLANDVKSFQSEAETAHHLSMNASDAEVQASSRGREPFFQSMAKEFQTYVDEARHIIDVLGIATYANAKLALVFDSEDLDEVRDALAEMDGDA